MSVKLREKQLQDGGVSLYLDIYHKGKRSYEFLDIRIEGKRNSEKNKQLFALAEQIAGARYYEIVVQGNGLPDKNKGKFDLFTYIDQYGETRSNKKNITALINCLTKYHDNPGPKPLGDVDKDWVVGFYRYMAGEGLGEQTRYLYFYTLSTIFNAAVVDGFIVTNPFHRIPKKDRPKRPKRSADSLSPAEVLKLAKKGKGIDLQLRQMFLLCCYCGLRWSDVRKLTWGQVVDVYVNGDYRKVVKVEKMKKTGEPLNVPLPETAIEILEQRKADAKELHDKSPYVFPRWSPEGPRKNPSGAVSKLMRRWAAKAGIERRVHFHLSRHTCATWMIESGSDLQRVKNMLGHEDIRNTEIYAHVSTGVLADAIDQLPKLAVSGKQKAEPKPAKAAAKKHTPRPVKSKTKGKPATKKKR